MARQLLGAEGRFSTQSTMSYGRLEQSFLPAWVTGDKPSTELNCQAMDWLRVFLKATTRKSSSRWCSEVRVGKNLFPAITLLYLSSPQPVVQRKKSVPRKGYGNKSRLTRTGKLARL